MRNSRIESLSARTSQENPYSLASLPNSYKSVPRRQDCPLDKDELGAATWAFLHTMVAYYPDKPTEEQKKNITQFFEIFSKIYPCESCAYHFREMLRSSPPAVTNQDSLSLWLCWVHNKVNQRIGKPLFDCKKVNQRWRDGWKDGSCS